MKKIVFFITFLLCIFSLASCGTVEDGIDGTKITKDTTSNTTNEDINNDSDPLKTVFKITLLWKGQPMPIDEDIEVIWMNRTTEKRAKVSDEGVATTTGLDGEFSVHLSKAPKGYSYDPNSTIVSNDSPEATIEIMKISKVSGLGNDLYEAYRITNITIKDKDKIGESYSYQATLKKSTSELFYEFHPKNAGIYTIESMVDVNDDLINPKVEIYDGTTSYKNSRGILDDGGIYRKGGYTKNFKYEYSIAEEELGGVATFRIFAETKDGVFPVTVDFRITYISFYEMEHADVSIKYGEDIYYKRDTDGNIIYETNASGEKLPVLNYVLDTDKTKSKFKTTYSERDDNGNYIHYIAKQNSYITGLSYVDNEIQYIRKRYKKNADGSYTEDYQNGTYVLVSPIKSQAYGSNYMDFMTYNDFKKGSYRILDGSRCFYNENDGYYHFDSVNGPIICAKITKPASGFALAMNHVEDPGNSQLRLFGTESHKRYVEGELSEICNSDGVCYVTKEIKEFLFKYSNSANLFFDGNGWCEQDGCYSEEEDQWMFACGFYY